MGEHKYKSSEFGKQSDEPAPEAVPVAMPSGITPDPDKPETIPPNLFSGATRRLDVHGEHPGFARRWANDDGDNVDRHLASGWTMVERKDVQLTAAVTPRNNDLGSHVRQWVGTDQQGQPMYAYLMEKPEWLVKLHNEGPGSREDYHRAIEQQIHAGTLGQTPQEKRYTAAHNPYAPGSGSSLPQISSSTKFVR